MENDSKIVKSFRFCRIFVQCSMTALVISSIVVGSKELFFATLLLGILLVELRVVGLVLMSFQAMVFNLLTEIKDIKRGG